MNPIIMLFRNFIEELKIVLGQELPGKDARNRMAPANRDLRAVRFNNKEKPRNSGILILLYPVNGEVYTVFIRRNEYEGPHSGQIGLPGGKCEEQDEDMIQTALRETNEELGINAQNIHIPGTISHLFIPVSNIDVLPVIGYMDEIPEFRPDKNEVKDIFKINLK